MLSPLPVPRGRLDIDRAVWKLLSREESKSSPFIASLYYIPVTKGQGENEREARSRLDYHRSLQSSTEKNPKKNAEFNIVVYFFFVAMRNRKVIRNISADRFCTLFLTLIATKYLPLHADHFGIKLSYGNIKYLLEICANFYAISTIASFKDAFILK